MALSENVRIDKWLWATRVYRTRSLAIAACTAGHVKIQGQNVKPSRSVRLNEIIAAQVGPITRTVKVLALLERRVGPKVVSQFLEDLTPAAEYSKPREKVLLPFYRPKGRGRPTKKERRALDRLSL